MIVRFLSRYSGMSEDSVARGFRIMTAEGLSGLGVGLFFLLCAVVGAALGYMMPGDPLP